LWKNRIKIKYLKLFRINALTFSRKKKSTSTLAKYFKRRTAIEAIIGHIKMIIEWEEIFLLEKLVIM